MTQADIIDALEAQKEQIQANYPTLLARCQSDLERATLQKEYQDAVSQWNDAVNQTLRANDPTLPALTGQLADIQKQVAQMVAEEADLGSILNKIASGVKIASSILTAAK